MQVGFLEKISCRIFLDFLLPLCCFNLFGIWWGQNWILFLEKSFRWPSFWFLYVFLKFFLVLSKIQNAVKDITDMWTINPVFQTKSWVVYQLMLFGFLGRSKEVTQPRYLNHASHFNGCFEIPNRLSLRKGTANGEWG